MMNYMTSLTAVLGLGIIVATTSPMDDQLKKQREELHAELIDALQDVSIFFNKFPGENELSNEKKQEIRDQIHESLLQAYQVDARILGSVGIY